MPELTYLGADILTSIRNAGMIPNTGATGSQDADLLRHASEGIISYVVAKINQLREQYYYRRLREPVTSGTATYRIPKRALWNKLANVWLIQNSDRIPMNPIPHEELEDYAFIGVAGVPAGYLIDGNYLRFVPDESPSLSGSIEWNFYLRPGNLVLVSECRQVTAVATPSVTLDSAVPASWSAADKFDIHSNASGCDYKDFELEASVVSGTGITFTREIDGSVYGTYAVEVGDYVCLEKTVALPGVPPELFPQVARMAAMHWAEATGNQKKFEAHANIFNEYLKVTMGSMEVRIEEKPLRIGTRPSFIDHQGGDVF